MTPLIFANNNGDVVAATYQSKGKRLILDGGMSRLYTLSGRYLTSAAAWLANFERFGNEVVASDFKKK